MDIPDQLETTVEKPICIFDGECGFCRRSVNYLRADIEDAVSFAPFQEVADDFSEIPVEAFERAVFFVTSDGRVYRGAEAIFQLLAVGHRQLPLWLYKRIPGFSRIADRVYRWVEQHRPLVARIVRFFYGRDPRATSWIQARNAFLKVLGLIVVAAFVSLGVQLGGLFGPTGIVPIEETVSRMGLDGFSTKLLEKPTLFAFGTSPTLLKVTCLVGVFAGLAIFGGLFVRSSLAVAYVGYLSFTTVGAPFLPYQWDLLLLETLFFSIFIAPVGMSGFWPTKHRVGFSGMLVMHWILFRTMFLSGVVKLTSGDESWSNLQALDFHFWTQPLPTWTSYYAAALPDYLLEWMTAGTLIIELFIPLLFLMPRRFRRVGALSCLIFQVSIALTGNYGFFNLLMIGLCLAALDDGFYRMIAARLGRQLADTPTWSRRAPRPILRQILVGIGVSTVLVVGGLKGAQHSLGHRVGGETTQSVLAAASPFRIVNNYGLFAVMTKKRPEILLQGSRDGQTWKNYTFKFKPDKLDKRPTFVLPHMPRLDWQLWFAGLRGCRRSSWWLGRLQKRLLEGSPEVEALLGEVPFDDEPPRYLRTVQYCYRFSDAPEAWWVRGEKQLFCPPVRLKNGQLVRARF
jgi:predicted DCC family thiol-disulfide oxidoreductase YuxK